MSVFSSTLLLRRHGVFLGFFTRGVRLSPFYGVAALFLSLYGYSKCIYSRVFSYRAKNVYRILQYRSLLFVLVLFMDASSAAKEICGYSWSVLVGRVCRVLTLSSLYAVAQCRGRQFQRRFAGGFPLLQVHYSSGYSGVTMKVSRAFISPLYCLFAGRFVRQAAISRAVLRLSTK